MKTKVLHIITYLPVGGAQDNTLLTVEHLDIERYELHLLYGPEGPWQHRARAIGHLRRIEMPTLVRPIHPLKDFRALIAMTRLIRREGYDIVHTHSSKPGFLGRLAARLAGTKIIIHTIHGFPFNDFMPAWKQRFFVTLERWASRLSHTLITVSELNRIKATELGIAPAGAFQTIYSGIDFSRFNAMPDRDSLRHSLGFTPEQTVLGFVGRLSPQKDPLCFVEALSTVVKSHPEVQVVLVGGGELEDQVRQRASELGLTGHITYLGFREDVPQLLHIMDGFVLSSRWEGLGRSLTEALYCGLPVVATRVEGVPELVKDGETGRLVEPGNSATLAQAIIDMIENPEASRAMALKGQALVQSLFPVQKMVDDIDRLYQTLLKKD